MALVTELGSVMERDIKVDTNERKVGIENMRFTAAISTVFIGAVSLVAATPTPEVYYPKIITAVITNFPWQDNHHRTV